MYPATTPRKRRPPFWLWYTALLGVTILACALILLQSSWQQIRQNVSAPQATPTPISVRWSSHSPLVGDPPATPIHPSAHPVAIRQPQPPVTPQPQPPAAPTSTAPAAPTSTAPAAPTSTATGAPNADPYPPYSGRLALYDPLQNNSPGYGWDRGGSCQFIGGAYHVVDWQNNWMRYCLETALQTSNFTFEVQMQIIAGKCGGLLLRNSNNKGTFYQFDVCRDGSYAFYRSDSYSTRDVTLTTGSSAAIITGLNQSNTIAVVTNGAHFDLYVNQQKIGSVYDRTYSQGQFGLIQDGVGEAAYTSARMWTL